MFSAHSQPTLDRIHAHIREWRTAGISGQLLNAIRREFHALENHAAAGRLDDIAKLSRGAQRLLAQRRGRFAQTADADEIGLLNLFEEIHDGLSADLGVAPAPSRTHVQFLNSMVSSLLLSDEERLQTETETQAQAETETKTTAAPTALASAVTRAAHRTQNHNLTDLCTLSDELGMARARAQHKLENTRQRLDALQVGCQQIGDGLRNLESAADARAESVLQFGFQPTPAEDYEASDPRAQLQSLKELQTALAEQTAQLSVALHAQLSAALRAEWELGERLHDGLRKAQLSAAADYLPRLRKLVTAAAARADQQVEFVLSGGDLQVDRQVMESLLTPLAGLIDDSVRRMQVATSHRASAPQPAPQSVLRIGLDLVAHGDQLLFEYADNGGGLERSAWASRAIAMGMTERAEKVGEAHLLQIMTCPARAAASSTATSTMATPPPADGWQAIYQAVRELGGCMALQSAVGGGLRFQFRVPQVWACSQALLVTIGKYSFAIRAHMIERLQWARAHDIAEVGGKKHLVIGAQRIPIIHLAAELGAHRQQSAPAEAGLALVLVRAVDRIVALEVDEMDNLTPMVGKPASRQLTAFGLRGVGGVAVLADGRATAVLDPNAFVERAVLCDDGLLQFPLTSAAAGRRAKSAHEVALVAEPSKQVIALQMKLGTLLIPLGMVAEVVGDLQIQPPAHASANAHAWLDGEIRWRGVNVPVVNPARAFGGAPTTDSPCTGAVILWPMKDGEANQFFALASCATPTLLEIEGGLSAPQSNASNADAPLDNLLGCVQLEHGRGMIPDLSKLARQIFQAPATAVPD